jgi:hypothetical protein
MATKRTLPLSALQQTLIYLFDDQPHALAGPFAHWLTTSKPFATFALTHQQKIRKKVRMAQAGEETQNLYCELYTAYLLLQEPKFAVEYEPYAIQQGRSPDFAVTYRTHTVFHVEVTRLRLSAQEQQLRAQETATESSAGENGAETLGAHADQEDRAAFVRRNESRRWADVVCDKLGQLAPNTPNVLWMWVQSQAMQEIEIEQLMPVLKRRIEQRDVDLLARYGLRNPADFMRQYQRLSVILVQNLHTPGADPLVWTNNDARYPLPAKVRDILATPKEESRWPF